jgi:hypothetical protein
MPPFTGTTAVITGAGLGAGLVSEPEQPPARTAIVKNSIHRYLIKKVAYMSVVFITGAGKSV